MILPPTPTPPATVKEPVVVEVEATAVGIFTVPFTSTVNNSVPPVSFNSLTTRHLDTPEPAITSVPKFLLFA